MAEKYKFEITNRGKQDLDDTLSYISERLLSPESASKLLDRALKIIDSICLFPYSYPLIDRNQKRYKDIHKAIVDNYIMFYIVDEAEQTVKILRIIYGRRDLEKYI